MENSEKLFLNEIIRLIKSSEKKYKEKNFKGSYEDKLQIKLMLKSDKFSNKEIIVKYKEELTKLYDSRFDLIKDYKMKIDDTKRIKIINLLEKKSEEKLEEGDYEGAIKALRRSEKYQYL